MDMDRPRALACRCLGIGQSLVDEYRLAAQPGRLVQLINVKFVLTLDRGDAAVLPQVGTIEFSASKTRANNAIVALAGDGSGTIQVLDASGGTVDFILDINGYFR